MIRMISITMVRTYYIILSIAIFTFSACTGKNDSGARPDINPKEEEVTDANDHSSVIMMDNVNLDKLKIQLDSFMINVKNRDFTFEYQSDTISLASSDKELWDFKKGIFELVNLDSVDLLIRNHFYVPNTKDVLRIYFLELYFKDAQGTNAFFNKLKSRKEYKADFGDGDYMLYGLTGTTDYVIQSNDKVLWFNIACQYTKEEFKSLISIFENYINIPEKENIIKCFCHQACE
jgi:hypothetical protein